jgi:hypothetical protein
MRNFYRLFCANGLWIHLEEFARHFRFALIEMRSCRLSFPKSVFRNASETQVAS